MIPLFTSFLTCFSVFFRSRYHLSLEILALRKQLGVLKRTHSRPRLRVRDRMFWILLRRFWPSWSKVLIIEKPDKRSCCEQPTHSDSGPIVAVCISMSPGFRSISEQILVSTTHTRRAAQGIPSNAARSCFVMSIILKYLNILQF